MKLLILALFCLGLVVQGSLAERTIIESAWRGAFKGQMTLAVDDCNSAINGEGWTITVEFDQPVRSLDIWRAVVRSRSADKKTYVLGNMQWNAVLYPGTYLELGFIGYTVWRNDQDGTRGTATLEGNGNCEEGSGSEFSSSSILEVGVGVGESSCDAELEVLDEWQGNFKGRVRVPISRRLAGGWTATLTFSEPLTGLQIWTASILSVDNNNQVYGLRNQQWNPTLAKNSVYEAEFIASFSGSSTPDFSFVLEDHPPCGQETTEEPEVDNGVCTCDTVRQLLDEWQGNFKGRARVPVTNALSGGWTAEIEFSEPVWSLQIWTAQVDSVDSSYTVYTVRNQQWNSDLAAGSYLEAEFIGTISAATPDFEFRLVNQPECECPEYYVPTTTIPTTSTQASTNPTTSQSTTTSAPIDSTTAEATTNPTTSELTSEPTDAPTNPPTSQPTNPPTSQPTNPPTSQPTNPPTSQPTNPPTKAPSTPPTNPPTKAPSPSPTEPPTKEPPAEVTTEDAGTTTETPQAAFDYDEVLHKSILFYEAQRSGVLPASNRIPYRGDSAVSDVGLNGEDLSGGWYDAGDTVKFGLPMAQSATVLAWGLLEYEHGYRAAGEYNNALDSIRWATNYFMKCHVSPNELYGQVGDGHHDHSLWVRPEELTGPRPAFLLDAASPGSDVAGETAAALAAASIVFKPHDAAYSEQLLTHARQLYSFANTYRGLYSQSIPNAASFYSSSGYYDELAYAAAWLHRATGEVTYLAEAEVLYAIHGLGGKPWAFSWDDKMAGLQVLLYQATGQPMYQSAVTTFLDSWLRGGDVPYTPGGLAWRSQWGALRYSANTAFLATIACRDGLGSQYCDFAQEQIHYMLGANGRSYVVGFGVNPPDRPHHRASSCPDEPAPCGWNEFNAPGPNPQILYGALVGGPDLNDNFQNDRSDYIQNEVTTDYNAGFQSAVAGLKELLIQGLISPNPRALL